MFQQNKGAAAVTLETALTVLQFGWVTIEQVREANAWRMKQCPRIGKLALISGKLTRAEVLTVLDQQRSLGKTFGQTAVHLGLLNQADVYDLLALQALRIPDIGAALVTLGFLTAEQAELAAQNDKPAEVVVAAEDDLDPVMMS